MNVSSFVRNAIFVLSIPLFIWSMQRLDDYNKTIQEEMSYQAGIEELAPQPIDTVTDTKDEGSDNTDKSEIEGSEEEKREVQSWAKDLLARNDEAVGWIKIPGFVDDNGKEYIDFPVLQHSDNDFYLSHDLDKNYYYSGSIYVDYADPIDDDGQPDNIVIYGHHMRNLGTAFTHLAEYKSGVDLLKKCPIIEFNTIYDQNKEYVIFSCYVAAEDATQDDELFDYWMYHYFDDEYYEFDTWIEKTLASSWYSCDIQCDEDDDYITLSTCSNETPDMRWVMVAKKLDSDDDKEAIISSYETKKDEDIYFPRVWKNMWGNHKKYLGWNY